jgi:hypothetical protein
MLVDGVRTDRGPLTPLPVPALSTDHTHRVMIAGRAPATAEDVSGT